MSLRLYRTVASGSPVTITAADGIIPAQKARHQIEASGTGTVTVAVDAGCGLRDYTSIDLANAARMPYTLELEAFQIRFTASASATVAYCAEVE